MSYPATQAAKETANSASDYNNGTRVEISAQLRPKLRQDSIFLPNNNGVLFRNGSNVFFLKGASTYRWISSLAPHLTGEHTLEELCQSLDPERREMVTRLVHTLWQKGIVKDHVPEDPALLSEAVRRQFAPQIGLIDHYADLPLKKFAAFRQSRILIVGAGLPFRALGAALARNGLETLFLAPTGDAEENWREINEEISALPNFHGFSPTQLRLDADHLAEELKRFQIVTYCSEEGSLRDVQLLNSQCYKAGVAFLPGIIFGGQSLIGPLVAPGTAGCWQCAMLRLSANLEERRSAGLWKRVALRDALIDEQFTSFIPTSKMLGNSLAFELFKALAGHQQPETAGGVLTQDLETLESSRSMLLPHPLCSVCAPVRPATEAMQLEEIAAGKHDRKLTEEAQLESWYRFIDPRVGIFQRFADEDSEQLPLRTTRLVVGHPTDAAVQPLLISAHSIESTALARHHALVEAVRTYARTVPDRRRMVLSSFGELLASGAEPLAAHQLSLWSGLHSFDERTRLEWLPAYSSFKQRLYYVLAAAVYPESSLNRLAAFERTTAGSAVGQTYQEVRADGLFSALTYERLREVVQARSEVVSLDAEVLSEMDSDLAYLIKTVGRLNESVRLVEFIGQLPLHVVLASAGRDPSSTDQILRVGSGLSRIQAVKRALIGLIGTLQDGSSQNGSGQYNYSSQIPFRRFSLPVDIEIRALARDGYEEHSATIENIDNALQSSGRDVLFVNTTTDDIRRTETFIAGTVLLSSGVTIPNPAPTSIRA